MSAGLPLLFLSVLSTAVMAVWVLLGPGSRQKRIVVGALFLAVLALSWGLLLSFGVFHSVGSNAMACAFLVALGGLVVPFVWRYLLTRRRHV